MQDSITLRSSVFHGGMDFASPPSTFSFCKDPQIYIELSFSTFVAAQLNCIKQNWLGH